MTAQPLVSSSRSYAAREAEMIAADTTVVDWLDLIRSEYLEMPGLHLTKSQVQRLWGLDTPTCEALLDVLVELRFLRRTRAGAYVRADSGGR
jgi:hypothetical protein